MLDSPSPKQRVEPAAHWILVVEDEEIVRYSLKQTLEREGYNIVTAVDGEDALTKLPDHEYSLILTDNLMPRMTGVELLDRAKNIQPDATRVIVTAVLQVDKLIELINQGEIYRFIAKPWIREELIASVHNAVQRYDLVCRNKILQAATLEINSKLKNLNSELSHTVGRIEEQNKALEQNLGRSIELCLGTMQTFYPVLGTQARRVHSICLAMANELRTEANSRNCGISP